MAVADRTRERQIENSESRTRRKSSLVRPRPRWEDTNNMDMKTWGERVFTALK
jgi:hypothetical protein